METHSRKPTTARRGLIAILLVLGSTPAAAQLCEGLASFKAGPIQLSGSGAVNKAGTAFGAGVALGGAGAFGGLGLGTTSIYAWNGSSFDMGASLGYQFQTDEKGSVQLCPLGSAGLHFGPHNILGTGYSYTETDLAAGLAFGMVAAQAGRINITPTASFWYENAAGELKDTSGYSFLESRSFGVLALGVGLVIDHQVSLRPSASIPIGASGASTSFALVLAVNFGGSH